MTFLLQICKYEQKLYFCREQSNARSTKGFKLTHNNVSSVLLDWIGFDLLSGAGVVTARFHIFC